MLVDLHTVFKRLGSRLGPAARLSGGPDPADAMATAARPADGDSVAAMDSTAAMPGVTASSIVDEAPAATSAGELRTSGSADSGTGPSHGVRLLPSAAATSAAAGTPLSGVGGALAGAGTCAGPTAPHIQSAARPALSPVGEDEEEEETVPLGHNPLARRVLAGRQSLVPCRHQVLATSLTHCRGAAT